MLLTWFPLFNCNDRYREMKNHLNYAVNYEFLLSRGVAITVMRLVTFFPLERSGGRLHLPRKL